MQAAGCTADAGDRLRIGERKVGRVRTLFRKCARYSASDDCVTPHILLRRTLPRGCSALLRSAPLITPSSRTLSITSRPPPPFSLTPNKPGVVAQHTHMRKLATASVWPRLGHAPVGHFVRRARVPVSSCLVTSAPRAWRAPPMSAIGWRTGCGCCDAAERDAAAARKPSPLSPCVVPPRVVIPHPASRAPPPSVSLRLLTSRDTTPTFLCRPPSRSPPPQPTKPR